MSILVEGELRRDLEIVGAGVRDATLPVPDRTAIWKLSVEEAFDLEAFQAAGWHFHPDPDLDWAAVRAVNGPKVEAGLLARRPWGGLVIIRNRLVFREVATTEFRRFMAAFEDTLADVQPIHSMPGQFTVLLRLPDRHLYGQLLEHIDAMSLGAVLRVHPLVNYNLRSPGYVVPLAVDLEGEEHWLQIRLQEAWDFQPVTLGRKLPDGTPICVAIIDLGFDVHHSDLQGNIAGLLAIDELGNVILNSTIDDNDEPHGTPCAGLVAALKNDVYVNGAAPECKLILIALKFPPSPVAMETAIRLCTEGITGMPPVDVISTSTAPSTGPMEQWENIVSAIVEAHRSGRNGNGIPIVWANYNADEPIPNNSMEGYDPLILVGACDGDERRRRCGFGPTLDLLAPGEALLVLDPGGGTGLGYDCSVAAPIVAGVAALMLARNPTLKHDTVAAILKTNCTSPIEGNQPNDYYGWGRVNALAAVKGVPPLSTAVTPPPPSTAART